MGIQKFFELYDVPPQAARGRDFPSNGERKLSISPFDDGTRSISGLARIFGRDRRTISKVIQERDVAPAGRSSGHDTYAIADVAAALYMCGPSGADDATAKERLDHWRGENERVKHERTIGQLTHIEDVRRSMATLIKPTAAMLDTLADVLERDAGLSPEQAAVIEQILDRERERLYNELRARTGPTDDLPEETK